LDIETSVAGEEKHRRGDSRENVGASGSDESPSS